jgi:hypothetical protein
VKESGTSSPFQTKLNKTKQTKTEQSNQHVDTPQHCSAIQQLGERRQELDSPASGRLSGKQVLEGACPGHQALIHT